MANKKYLDYDGLAYLWSKILAKERTDNKAKVTVGSGNTEISFSEDKPLTFIQGSNITLTPNATNGTITINADAQPESFTNVGWDSTNKAITKTISGSSSNVMTFTQGSNISLTASSTGLTIAAVIPLTDISFNSTSNKLQKTLNGTTTDVVAFGTAAFANIASSYDASDSTQPVTGAIVASAMSASGLTKFSNIQANGSTAIPAGTANDAIDFINNGPVTWSATAGTGKVNVTPSIANASSSAAGLLSASMHSKLDGFGYSTDVSFQESNKALQWTTRQWGGSSWSSTGIQRMVFDANFTTAESQSTLGSYDISLDAATVKTTLGLGTAAYQAYTNMVTNVAKTSNANTITVTKGGSSTSTISTGAAAWKGVDTSISAGSTSTALPTTAAVVGYVTSAIGDLEGISFEVVASLPATGDSSIIYLVSNSGTGTNSYDEYIWLTSQSAYEKIGTTDVDLSNYMTYTAYNGLAMSTSDIDTAIAAGEAL